MITLKEVANTFK